MLAVSESSAIESASLVIAAVGLVVGIILGVAGTWATARGRREPRRQLTYGCNVIPLWPTTHEVTGLEIRRGGDVYKEPHIVDVVLIVRGNVDIERVQFDGNQPLLIDLGADVVDILKIESNPEGVMVPPIAKSGTGITIGPSFLSRRHELFVSVLVDGKVSLRLQSPILGTTPRLLEDVERRYDSILAVVDGVASVGFGGRVLTAVARAIVAAEPFAPKGSKRKR